MELLLLLVPLLLVGTLFGDGGSDDGGDQPPDSETGTINRGTDAAATVSADAGINMVLGAGGADTISGNGGDDFLLGELGADSLSGGAGEDVLGGAWGNDTLDGGEGADLLVGGSGDDDLTGGGGDDLLIGSSGRDLLEGNSGDDLLIGLDPARGVSPENFAELDTADFEAELRAIFGPSLTETDIRRALVGVTNTTAGETGPDVLRAADGNDTLVGDDGDVMTGGAGVDEFAVLSGAGNGVVSVLDFDPTQETLAILVDGPPVGTVTFQNDSVGDGLDVLLNGVRVANLEGVFSNEIRPGSLTLQSLA